MIKQKAEIKKKSTTAKSEAIERVITQEAIEAAKAMVVAMTEVSEESRRHVTGAGQANTGKA